MSTLTVTLGAGPGAPPPPEATGAEAAEDDAMEGELEGRDAGSLGASSTTAAGAPVAEVPITVLEPVELAGILGRAWDSIRLWIK